MVSTIDRTSRSLGNNGVYIDSFVPSGRTARGVGEQSAYMDLLKGFLGTKLLLKDLDIFMISYLDSTHRGSYGSMSKTLNELQSREATSLPFDNTMA